VCNVAAADSFRQEPGALTNSASYVFADVIKALTYVGYTKDNMEAAPYDWRLVCVANFAQVGAVVGGGGVGEERTP
jgi:predicted glycosyltransferase